MIVSLHHELTVYKVLPKVGSKDKHAFVPAFSGPDMAQRICSASKMPYTMEITSQGSTHRPTQLCKLVQT